jgi:hypothetical protein
LRVTMYIHMYASAGCVMTLPWRKTSVNFDRKEMEECDRKMSSASGWPGPNSMYQARFSKFYTILLVFLANICKFPYKYV